MYKNDLEPSGFCVRYHLLELRALVRTSGVPLSTYSATISIPFLAAKSDIARCCASILSSRWLSEENRAYDAALSGVLGWFGIDLRLLSYMIKALEDHAYSLTGETVEGL